MRKKKRSRSSRINRKEYKKRKRPFNWFLVAVGALMVASSILTQLSSAGEVPLRKLRIVLSDDIKIQKGTHRDYAFSFRSTEYGAEFILLRGSLSSGSHGEVGRLRAGQTLYLEIAEADYANRSFGGEEITVYSLSANGRVLLSPKDFARNLGKYHLRISLISGLVGGLMLLVGLAIITKRTSWIVMGVGFLVLLLLRFLRIGIY